MQAASSGARVLELWLSTPWYFQLMNFIFLVLIAGVVAVILVFIIRTINVKWSLKKGTLELNPNKEEGGENEGEHKEGEDEDGHPTLLHHRVFNVLKSIQSSSVLHIDENTIKGAIGATFLKKCKFPVWEKNLIQFMTEVEQNKSSIYSLTTKFVEIEKEFFKLAETTPVVLPNEVVLPCIPRVYVEKYERLMNQQIQIKNLDAILNSRYYPEWRERAVACLDMLCYFFETSFSSAVWAMESLNGDLDREIIGIIKKF